MAGSARPPELKLPALSLAQHRDHAVYLFAIQAHQLASIADVSRIRRGKRGELLGYQRSEVRRHVQDIAKYLDQGESVLFPSAVVLAFTSPNAVTFHRARVALGDGRSPAGVLHIPLPPQNGARPALIVDGQQRALALARSRNPHLPVPVSAFVAADPEVQRDQFVRINNTRPLPRGLLAELLPGLTGPLPRRMHAFQAPALLCERLSADRASPFYRSVRLASRASGPVARQRITGTAVVAMIRDSFERPTGCLLPYRNSASGETDIEAAYALLRTYWLAVREVFPEAWRLPPHESRLTHSVGVRAMGRLMDRVMAEHLAAPRTVEQVVPDLERVKDVCNWTAGFWPNVFGLRWDELQMVPAHLDRLAEVLVDRYRRATETQ